MLAQRTMTEVQVGDTIVERGNRTEVKKIEINPNSCKGKVHINGNACYEAPYEVMVQEGKPQTED